MNELQLGLIGLGAAAVVGVVGYNKWQEHRHRKVAEQLLKRDHGDVLLAGQETRVHELAPESEPVAFAPPSEVFAAQEPARYETPPSAQPMEPALSPEPEAPLPGHLRQEPTLRSEPSLDEPVLTETVEAVESTETPAPELVVPALPVESPAPARVAEPSSALAGVTDEEGVPAILVSAAIDYVARLELMSPLSGAQLLGAQGELLGRIAKPVTWAGFNERIGKWEQLEPANDAEYRRLRVGLLLADRRGPLGEADLLTFQGAMQGLAEDELAAIELPPGEPALSAAIALDQFCANVDIQIGLNLISRGTVFPGTKIRALAEAAGMVLDASGRFARCDDDGRVLYTLANQESAGFSLESMRTMSTHGLAFTLDVACVTHGDRVFAQMLDLARRMADVLNGVLVDDNRRPLTEAMLEPFRRQIAQYQSQLAARGIPAGGPLALRLFS